jgi:hypothetical protein
MKNGKGFLMFVAGDILYHKSDLEKYQEVFENGCHNIANVDRIDEHFMALFDGLVSMIENDKGDIKKIKTEIESAILQAIEFSKKLKKDGYLIVAESLDEEIDHVKETTGLSTEREGPTN